MPVAVPLHDREDFIQEEYHSCVWLNNVPWRVTGAGSDRFR
jgi:hypothetical protein